jgi:hypothetical protein
MVTISVRKYTSGRGLYAEFYSSWVGKRYAEGSREIGKDGVQTMTDTQIYDWVIGQTMNYLRITRDQVTSVSGITLPPTPNATRTAEVIVSPKTGVLPVGRTGDEAAKVSATVLQSASSPTASATKTPERGISAIVLGLAAVIVMAVLLAIRKINVKKKRY